MFLQNKKAQNTWQLKKAMCKGKRVSVVQKQIKHYVKSTKCYFNSNENTNTFQW